MTKFKRTGIFFSFKFTPADLPGQILIFFIYLGIIMNNFIFIFPNK